MEFNEDAEIVLNDVWYDLTDGGYIKPSKLLKNEDDIKKVEDAIKTLQDFFKDAEEKGIVIEL